MTKTEADHIFTEDLYSLQKKVMVVIPTPFESVQQNERTLLEKILASVKLSLDSVQVLQLNKPDIRSLKIYNPQLVLSFGSQFSNSSNLYTLETIDNVQMIQTDGLEELDDQKKKALWGALKQAFQP